MKKEFNTYILTYNRRVHTNINQSLFYFINKDSKMNKIFYKSIHNSFGTYIDNVSYESRPDWIKLDSAEFPHIFTRKIWK